MNIIFIQTIECAYNLSGYIIYKFVVSVRIVAVIVEICYHRNKLSRVKTMFVDYSVGRE
jgi:hypothetical protein